MMKRKRKRWFAGLLTLVGVVTMTLNLAPTALANGDGEPEYVLRFKDIQRDWCYTDEALNLSLDKTGLEGLEEDYSIKWFFGWWNDATEEEEEFSKYNLEGCTSDTGLFVEAKDVADLKSSLVRDPEGNESERLIIHAVVQNKAGDEIAEGAYAEIEFVEPFCEYYYPVNSEGEIDIVAGWDCWIDANMGACVENGAHPYGEGVNVSVTNIVSSDKKVVEVVKEDGEDGGYILVAGSQAWGKSATITITHDDLLKSGNTISYQVKVNVVDTVTNLNVWSSKTSNQVLPEETVKLYANAVQEWDGGSISFPGELEEEAILEWSTEQDGVTIEVNGEAPDQCEVTVSDELLYQDAVVTATLYQKNNNGSKGDKLASQSYSLFVTEEYYEIELRYRAEDKNFDTLYPGENCEVTPVLWYYNCQANEREEITDVYWEVEPDNNALSVSGPEDGVYTISRTGSEGVNLNLYAYIGEEKDTKAAEAGWWFDEVNGAIWFEDYDFWMYTDKAEDDPYTVHLNTDQLGGMTYTVKYQFVNEDGEEITLDEETLKACISEDENHLVSLNAAKIYKALEDYVVDKHVSVTLRAVLNEDENNSTQIDFEVYEPHVDYYPEPEGDHYWTTLVGVEDYLWISVDGWKYCAESPYGEYISCELVSCEIDDEDVLAAKKVEEDGIQYYKLIGKKNGGETAVTITYKDYEGNETELKATVFVSDEDYYAVINGDTNLIRPGNSLELEAELYRCYLDDSGDPVFEKVSKEALEKQKITCKWMSSDDEEFFTLVPDTYSCIVTASTKADYNSANISCKFVSKDDEDICYAESEFYVEAHSDPYYDWTIEDDRWIDTFSGYYYLGYDKPVTFEVKELISHYVEDVTGAGLTLSGISYSIAMDDEAEAALNIVQNSNGKYTVSRTGDGDVTIWIQAYRNKTLVAEYEVTFYDYSVYTVADHKVSLCPGQSDTVTLSIHRGDYDVDQEKYEETETWSVSEFEWLNEDEVKALLGSDVTVTQSGDTFTISVAKGSTAKGNITVELAAHLLDGTVLRQTVALGDFGHDYETEIVKEATATEEGLRKYTCKNCGDSYTETIAKTETGSKDDNNASASAGTKNDKTDSSVKTGDNNSVIVWAVVAIAALAAAVLLIVRRKGNR